MMVVELSADFGAAAKRDHRKRGELAYRENHLVDGEGQTRQIKRHYFQTVTDSPIVSEVKIELDTNEVLWLSPADGAGAFSDNWVGVMLSPKAGVIVQELRPLICKPVK